MRRIALTAAIAAACLVAAPGLATADTATGGTPESYQSANRGFGTASADADASTGGGLDATGSTRGGGGLLGGLAPATSSAYAGVKQSFEASGGSYRVTITYGGARGVENTSGGGIAGAQLNSIAQFVCTSNCASAPRPVAYFDDLSAGSSTVTKSFLLSVPRGESGYIVLTGRAISTTRAGANQSATATASVDSTTFSVERA